MASRKRKAPSASSSPPTHDASTDPVTAYALDVRDGRVPACRLVRLACERHLRDQEQGSARGLRFDPALATWAISFFGFCRHYKGEWAGHVFDPSPWQKFVIGSVFGWVRKDGTRRFRVVYEEIPRKNGKSTKLAGIGLLGLIADGEPGAEIYSAATKKDQARIIFGDAVMMRRKSPELRDAIGERKNNLHVEQTASKFEPLSSDERTLDGLNPHMVLVDELHKHKSRALLDVLDTALGARRQPLLWIITTAGTDDPESVYATENAYAQQVLEGVVADDSFFAFIATIDKGDRWDDPIAWAKANPNLGVSCKLEDLERQALKASKSPPALKAFKRLRLNVRTGEAGRYIDMEVWRRNGIARFDPEILKGRRCYGGLDLSSKIDLSAWVLLFPPIGDETRWRIVPRFWMPSDTIEAKSDRDRVQYQRWVDDHLIDVTTGNIIDHSEIELQILADAKLYDIQSAAFDPWNAAQLTVSLVSHGLPLCEFIQGLRTYTAPTKELEAMLLAEKLDHGNNPVLDWMAANLAVQEDKNLNRMPTKRHSIGRIDGMTALIMAIGRSMNEEASPYSDGRSITIV
jgi:phage terminase large subunit-like protein